MGSGRGGGSHGQGGRGGVLGSVSSRVVAIANTSVVFRRTTRHDDDADGRDGGGQPARPSVVFHSVGKKASAAADSRRHTRSSYIFRCKTLPPPPPPPTRGITHFLSLCLAPTPIRYPLRSHVRRRDCVRRGGARVPLLFSCARAGTCGVRFQRPQCRRREIDRKTIKRARNGEVGRGGGRPAVERGGGEGQRDARAGTRREPTDQTAAGALASKVRFVPSASRECGDDDTVVPPRAPRAAAARRPPARR